MRNTISESAKLGAVIGFTIAILYAIIVLVVVESQLPIPNPSIKVIFTPDFFEFEFPILLTASPIWLLTPTLIGSITTGVFAYLISKFQFNKKGFFIINLLLSTVVTLPLLILYRFMVISLTSGKVIHSLLEPILEIKILLLFPSLIYIFIAVLTGQHLHTRLHIKSHDAITSA